MTQETISLIGFAAGACTVTSFLPQVIHTLKTKKTKDISLGMYFILLTGAVLWTGYGFLTFAPSVYLTNIAVFSLASIIFYLKIRNG